MDHFDSRRRPRGEWTAEFVEAVHAGEQPVRCRFHGDRAIAVVSAWQVGGFRLWRQYTSAHSTIRSTQLVERVALPRVVFSITDSVSAIHRQFGAQRRLGPGEPLLVDYCAPFSTEVDAVSTIRSISIPRTRLGVGADVIGAAVTAGIAPVCPHTPMMSMIAALFSYPHRSLPGTHIQQVGSGFLASLRAAMSSAAGEADCAASTLVRIFADVHDHLRDPYLTPSRLARRHHLSVQRLSNLCADEGVNLQQWIVSARIEAGRRLLVETGQPVAAIAAQVGYTSPSHFTTRFLDAFALPPSDYRRQHRQSRRREPT
ncbi:helix-turn-helix transcriptional regulator [Nocardia asteroides]|uniref:helix-turn-helix transcriptional regulator n=1 Tax=Nocardia asteroides TaxID=1824 RepID=UPI0037CC037F